MFTIIFPLLTDVTWEKYVVVLHGILGQLNGYQIVSLLDCICFDHLNGLVKRSWVEAVHMLPLFKCRHLVTRRHRSTLPMALLHCTIIIMSLPVGLQILYSYSGKRCIYLALTLTQNRIIGTVVEHVFCQTVPN